MIEAFAAKSGFRSLRIDGIALHSPYDPVREAHRFAREGIGDEAPSTVLVLGEGLGYIGDAVADIFPGSRVIRVLYSADVFRAGPSRGPLWVPGQQASLAHFLLRQIGELDLEGLRVLEWPPSARLFPAMSREANGTVKQVLQQLNGSLVTTIATGRLWLRNSVQNFLALESILEGSPCAEDRPVLVAAPGPSLEQCGPLIRAVLPLVDLWALPSSMPFLLAEGLVPDLVVMTDPGFYSMHHLSFAVPGCPIAMPISAARGAWCLPTPSTDARRAPPYLLLQPDFFEEAILGAAGVDAIRVAPHGTVAATALDLALASTRAPVIIAGLDMCARDILFHARPNAFDTLLHLRASRTAPHHSLVYQRSTEQHAEKLPAAPAFRASLSLRTYAGWFEQPAAHGQQHPWRLLPSPVPLGRMRDLDASGLKDLAAKWRSHARGPRVHARDGYPDGQGRRKIVKGLMTRWIEKLEGADKSVRTEKRLEAAWQDPTVSAVAYALEPRLLLESRRKLRKGDLSGAVEKADEMLQSCDTFLRRLEEQTRAGR